MNIFTQGQYKYCLQVERTILVDVEVCADSEKEALEKYYANDTSSIEEITDCSDVKIDSIEKKINTVSEKQQEISNRIYQHYVNEENEFLDWDKIANELEVSIEEVQLAIRLLAEEGLIEIVEES